MVPGFLRPFRRGRCSGDGALWSSRRKVYVYHRAKSLKTLLTTAGVPFDCILLPNLYVHLSPLVLARRAFNQGQATAGDRD